MGRHSSPGPEYLGCPRVSGGRRGDPGAVRSARAGGWPADRGCRVGRPAGPRVRSRSASAAGLGPRPGGVTGGAVDSPWPSGIGEQRGSREERGGCHRATEVRGQGEGPQQRSSNTCLRPPRPVWAPRHQERPGWGLGESAGERLEPPWPLRCRKSGGPRGERRDAQALLGGTTRPAA
ncbi:hypothetical protein NDU88_004282 [Pleurodeles waltl]|uniref:Uncharacterized protein n=1 Tax=Pleurodeles waltl TaxID=8319 RepID=A0AAV7MV11_PLEWA|nr:hypothetical protein NDU88_004282 [Pleurodeles waltl]